jgi:sterol 3beta-glucosyltransferase
MRIVILTLGSRGDVQPYIALARQAIKKGHSAIICTGKTFEKLITDNGVEFAETETDLMAMLETKEGQMILKSAAKHPFKTKKYLDTVISPAFRKTLEQFWQAMQGADIVIYHPKAFGAADMSEVLGIPCVSMPPVPITYPIEEFPNLAISATKNFGSTINKWTYTIMAKAESANIKQLNDFRQNTLHLPKRKAGEYAFEIRGKEIPVVYPISKTLFEDVKSWKDKVFLPGFFFIDEVNQILESRIQNFIDNGNPPIVISFSSMPLKIQLNSKINC